MGDLPDWRQRREGEERKMKDDSYVATGINYGVASFLSRCKSMGNLESSWPAPISPQGRARRFLPDRFKISSSPGYPTVIEWI